MFYDRYDAGNYLASKLKKYTDANAVVYALPRGGVVTGMVVAQKLRIPLELLITRKIGHPLNIERAICAITEEGDRICDDLGLCGVDSDWIEVESMKQQGEILRRRIMYKESNSVLSAYGKTAILVDDGIATGLTMKAAIYAIKKQNPRKVVVAVPVAPSEVVRQLEALVDEVVIVKVDTQYLGAVSSYYTHFPEVSDREVTSCLKKVPQTRPVQRAAAYRRFF